jgi:pyridoxamine 5'-phosphate oxidase
VTSLRGRPSFPDELPNFDPDAVPAEPHQLFDAWLRDAGEHGPAAHAVTLSTVDADGAPDARVVILKAVDETGFAVATSAESPTGVQLSKDPRAALTFFWPARGRQVRVRGPVAPCPPEESARDFRERSPASRTECLIGRQSEVLADPADLLAAAEGRPPARRRRRRHGRPGLDPLPDHADQRGVLAGQPRPPAPAPALPARARRLVRLDHRTPLAVTRVARSPTWSRQP